MSLTSRKNGQPIDASWFNAISAAIDALNENESTHEIANGQAATALINQAFDGAVISSVRYFYEAQRNDGSFANGEFAMQFVSSAWRIADGGYEGEDHGLTLSAATVGTVGTLKVASSSGPGTGTLKLKRRTFSV